MAPDFPSGLRGRAVPEPSLRNAFAAGAADVGVADTCCGGDATMLRALLHPQLQRIELA